MNSFIYDNYGYYCEDESFSFDYKSFHFSLEECFLFEEEIDSLNAFLIDLDAKLVNQGMALLKNRNGCYLTPFENGNLVMVSIKNFDVNFNLIKQFALKFYSSSPLPLNLYDIKNMWNNKLTLIKERILPSLKKDSFLYEGCQEAIHLYLGLCENALEYIEDIIIDYGKEIEILSLAHKRIINLTSYELFNPFNMVYDSPLRDLSFLYMNDLININEINEYLSLFPFSLKDYSYLLARCLYPYNIIDLLEKSFYEKNNVKKEIIEEYSLFNKRIKKISSLYFYLIKRFPLRPIRWLKNYDNI